MDAPTTVVGVFDTRDDAQRGMDALLENGFTADEIGVISRDKGGPTGEIDMNEPAANAGAGAFAGAMAGAGLGGLVGLGVVAGIVPVIGPALAGGTLGVILTNALGGAAVAGVVGALAGLGVPRDEAEGYQRDLEAGKTLVSVTTSVRAEEARELLRQAGGRVDRIAETPSSTSLMGAGGTPIGASAGTSASALYDAALADSSKESPGARVGRSSVTGPEDQGDASETGLPQPERPRQPETR
ncbi:MAG TPA: hypothetical protein VEJ63_17635 [Planctomycetota bacterium]|nr:hypothetical protein [Planctomycetota bacterium]